jgi:NAD(P)-dependent dehydrogenase (short-subunit alcohol dehydrogenase family)
MESKLTGTAALVTGASSGIGAATARQLAERANIGVVGLAVMGANPARNLASREAIRSLPTTARRDGLVPSIEQHPEAGFVTSESVARPRRAEGTE